MSNFYKNFSLIFLAHFAFFWWFYLRSRGFSEAEAREMLVLGFFEEVLARAPEAFREDSLSGIRRRLPEVV